MPVVSVTRLRVRSWFYLPAFFFSAVKIAAQAKNAPGNLAVLVLRERSNAFWTLTSWASEAAVKEFMLAKPHGPAMRKLLEWCDEAALVRWTQDGAELPTWAEAHARMLQDGRASKVNHPSEAHKAFVIPAPPLNPRSQARLK